MNELSQALEMVTLWDIIKAMFSLEEIKYAWQEFRKGKE